MTAIDLIARFFVAVNNSSLTYPHAGILVTVAAGLDNVEDISNFLGFKSTAGMARTLKELTKKGYLNEEVDDFADICIYSLTPQGKDTVRELLHFIPKKK